MSSELIVIEEAPLRIAPGSSFSVPALIAGAGKRAAAVSSNSLPPISATAPHAKPTPVPEPSFLDWCEEHGLTLERIEPMSGC